MSPIPYPMKILILSLMPLVAASTSAAEIVVKDTAGLKAALSVIKPDTILKIAPGEYGAGHQLFPPPKPAVPMARIPAEPPEPAVPAGLPSAGA